MRKKPPDGGLLLDSKDRRLKTQCQECGVTFYIGHEETSQQTSKRRATLRRSINAAKKKMRRLEETDEAREARLQDDRANKESKRQAESEGVRTVRLQKQAVRQDLRCQKETTEAQALRLQRQALRQQFKRDEITTSETTESRQNRLQSEAQRKHASRVGSPSRSSSDSDVVTRDVVIDFLSTDESSDESMDNAVQMTCDDTASHLNLLGMLTDKLEVDEKVKSALEQLIQRTVNGDGSHSMPVCVVCDQFIIGVEEVCSISKEILLKNKERLSWSTLESFLDRKLPAILKQQYTAAEDPDLAEMILSPRSLCTNGMKSYPGCKACRNALRGSANQKRSTPPTKAIANGNIFGPVSYTQLRAPETDSKLE